MDALVPAATAKAAGEAKDIQAIIDAQQGGFQLQPWDWELLLRAGAQGEIRPRRSADQALLRAEQRAAERRLLRRQPALRPHVQGAPRHSRLSARTCACSKYSTPTASRWRSAIATTSSATTRTAARGWTASLASRSCWARCPSSTTSPTSPSPRRASPR